MPFDYRNCKMQGISHDKVILVMELNSDFITVDTITELHHITNKIAN